MRTYRTDEACGFRFSSGEWAEFSNFYPLPKPIPAGPWLFSSSEALYQAAKFPAAPEIQEHISIVAEPRDAARLGRNPDFPINPSWTAQRVNVMRWVLRRKLETLPALIGPVLDRTGDRPIVEISTRDPYWGAGPVHMPDGPSCRGHNVLGRLWMELRQHRRDGDPLLPADAWLARIRVGRLSELPT